LRIHTLEIGANNFDDDGIRILSSALIRLIYFGLRGDLNISASGWLDLSAIFSCPTCSIRRLWFRGTNISDDGVISFGNALAVNKTIISLDLRDSKTITLAGWRGIASCLRSRISTLEELNLRNCNIDEQSASEIVAALVGNKVLQRLDMLEDFENEMSEYEGFMIFWNLVSRVLCDKTTIDSTFTSNHRICYIFARGWYLKSAIQDELISYEYMNDN